MDLTEMMDKLVIDLKMTLDTEISTAEATRCIDRAVDDLSRHLPRERIYEHTWIEAVTDDSFTTPTATSDTSIVNGITLVGVTDGDMATLVTNWLDVPRPLKVTVTDPDKSITRMTLIVKGTDADGIQREERFYRHGGLIQYGKVYFSSIKEIEINEISGNGASDILSVGTTAGAGVWIQLEYPIEPGSEGIYSAPLKAGTKYILDTDYEMDYANGRIRILSAGSMAVNTPYYANYDRAPCHIDISPIVPDLIRISKVIYPVDKVPEQSVAFSVWEDMLIIGSPRPGVSQEALTDKEHIAIFYEAKHTPPTDYSSGSYPEVLDQVVLIGAAGYALLIEAQQYEQQTVTDLASARTALTVITSSGVHGLITSALAKAAVLLTATSGKIDVALTKVALYLETSDTTDNAKDVLANITDDITDLRTAIATANTAANSTLDGIDLSAVSTHLTSASDALAKVTLYLETNETGNGGADNAVEILENITDDIAELRTKIIVAQNAMATYVGAVSTTDLDAASVGAVAWLLEGELLINKLNDGENVPERFADYARTKVQIAQIRVQAAAGYGQEGGLRLSNLRSYIEEATAWIRIGEGFIAESSQRVAMSASVTNAESVKINQAIGYAQEAASRLDTLRSYIEESGGWMRMGETFIAEAQILVGQVNACATEAATHISRLDRYIAEAAQHQETANIDMVLSDRFRAEAMIRLTEFHDILKSKAEYRKRVVSVPVRQPG